MSRVLVLGGHGFLGHHVVRQVRAATVPVVVGPPRADLDLLGGSDLLTRLLRTIRPTVVVNATGCVRGSAEELMAGNLGTVRAIVAACAVAGVSPRLVHLGSLAEYGPGSGAPFRESDVARPVTPYGRAKLAATEAVIGAGVRGVVDPVVLRVANPVGEGQPATTLAGSVLAQLRSAPGEPVRTGVLSAVRDIVSAADVGRAVVAALTATAPPVLVNVGTGVPVTTAELVRTLLDVSGHTAGLVVAGPGSTRSAADDVACPDVTLARTGLGWQAVDGLREAVDDLFAAATRRSQHDLRQCGGQSFVSVETPPHPDVAKLPR